MTKKELFNQFKVGDRVLFSGFSNYSYHEGKHFMSDKNIQHKELGTVISRSDTSITVKLDKIEGNHKPHRTNCSLLEWDSIEVLPMEHYAVIGLGDFICSDKKLEKLY